MQQLHFGFHTSRAIIRNRNLLPNDIYSFRTFTTLTSPKKIPGQTISPIHRWHSGLSNILSIRRTIADVFSNHKRNLSTTSQCKYSSRWYRQKNEALARRILLQKRNSGYRYRFRALLDSIPPNFIIFGILGINTAIYVTWQYANHLLVSDYPYLK